jgi:SAM-dependent methyltransferase
MTIYSPQNVTLDNFDEEGYLKFNRDVNDAVKQGLFVSGIEHFLSHGHAENRQQCPPRNLDDPSRRKRLSELQLRGSHLLDNYFEKFIANYSKDLLPIAFDSISSNPYDEEVLELFSDKGKLFLDLGAGWRNESFENVINLEIYDYPSTDIISFAEKLPFADCTFDGAVALAVLEHVRDPFAAAAEILRVVRPGGAIIIDWPFLQPEHGYPFHYFNATSAGAQEAFARNKSSGEIQNFVPPHMHPIATLHWILDRWKNGLQGKYSKYVFLFLPIGFFLRKPWQKQLGEKYTRLNPEVERILASGNRLIITRK